MLDYICPECNGKLIYEVSTKHFICNKCGLYATREQLYDLKDRLKPQKKKASKESEYFEWWMSKGKK